MDSISYAQFQSTLRAAVGRRTQEYRSIYSITVRWEKDDTNAESDTNHFQNMLKNLDIGPAEELVIDSEDLAPEFTLSRVWLNFSEKARLSEERSLIIFHYAGHGIYKNGSFKFADTIAGLKTMDPQSVLFNDIMNPAMFPEFNNTDVLFIFDCCYGQNATRAPDNTHRAFEVLAATSTRTESARSPSDSTFTAKLADEIARRKRLGHRSFEFASVYESLRKESTSRVRPTHALLAGATSVNLPLTGYRTVDPRDIPADYKALFSVTISRDLTRQDLKELVAWIRNRSPFTGLAIDSMYYSAQSTCLIMQAALSVYTKLHHMQGYTLIAENPGDLSFTHRYIGDALSESVDSGSQSFSSWPSD